MQNATFWFSLLALVYFFFTVFTELRLDWLSGNWYLVSEDDGLVYLCTNAMAFCRVILQQVDPLSSLALDPTKGYMFYTDWTPSLSRSLLDGSNRTVLVTDQVYHPSSVTLDLANELVYWIDIYKDEVERVNYEGQDRWTLKRAPDVSIKWKKYFHRNTKLGSIVYILVKNSFTSFYLYIKRILN